MRILIVLLGLIIFNVRGISQNIENVDFNTYEDHIQVTYDLVNCPLNTVFDLTLVFVKPNGQIINPKNLSGDIESVNPGYKKIIKWYFRNDIEDYSGELKAVLTIKGFNLINQPKTSNQVGLPLQSTFTPLQTNSNTTLEEVKKSYKIGGGADNVILSMLLPGFGDHFVNSKEHAIPLLISAAYLGAVYTAFNSKKISDDNYDIYSKSRVQSEMDKSFNKASEFRDKANFAFGVAASIWLIDVIRVAAKGSKNDRLRNSGYSKMKLIPRYLPTKKNNAFQLTFVKTF